MRMNSNLILAGQQPDILGQIGRANQIAGQEGEINRVNHLNQLYRDRGADIAAGRPDAINALAQFSPQEALGIQGARQSMAMTDLQMQQMREQAKQRAAQEASRMTAEQRAREVAEAQKWARLGEVSAQSGDLQSASRAATELTGTPIQFGSIEELQQKWPAIVALTEGAVEGVLGVREFLNPQYKPQSSEGKFYADLNAGAIPEGTVRTPSTVVHNDMRGQSAWDTKSAEMFVKKYDDISAGAGNAAQLLGLYDMAEGALDTGVRTGFGAEAELSLKQLAIAMGLPVDENKVAGGELVRAVQNRMALTMRSPDGGMGMPGALSDRDIKFLKDSQIGIDRSEPGNRRMLAAFRRIEQRKIEIAELADAYINEHNRLDHGFNKVVRDFADANPLFDDLEATINDPAGNPAKPRAPVNVGGYTIREVE